MGNIETQYQESFAKGHDAPVGDRVDDLYNRWAIATTISNVIATSPPEWSTRIGLFGRWGDGKTTVLNFLEKQQKDNGNIVIKYSPWGSSTEAQVWKDFGVALIKGLSDNGIPFSLWGQFFHNLRRYTEKIAKGTEVAGNIAQASGYVPYAKLGAEYASNIIRDQLKLKPKDIQRILSQLGNRKVVVFIDDLDRADPAIVPKLLLALRELLDFSGFAFVLAFDRQIVSTALQGYNAAWLNSGNDFLDKVIDFQFNLPAPTTKQIKSLALFQFKMTCSFVPADAIDEVAKLLPSNPRKLKLFSRMISSMGREATRHEVAELDWPVILAFGLLRAESEAFANELLSMMIDTDEYTWAEWAMIERNGEQNKQMEAIKALIEKHSDLKGRETRITLLAEGFRDRCSSQPGERLRYQMQFALSPHCITWGEFKDFFRKWQATKSIEITRGFIEARTSASEKVKSEVETELLTTIVSQYALILENASSVVGVAEHNKLMGEALATLDLLNQCIITKPTACELDLQTIIGVWNKLYSLFMQWRHFNANEMEPELREKEKVTLIALSEIINDPLILYEQIKPWSDNEYVFDGRAAELKNEFRSQICSVLKPEAIIRAMLFVSTPGQLKKLRSHDEHLSVRYFLTAPDSPCFIGQKKVDLVSAINARKGTTACMQDALDWLDLLLVAISGSDNICTAADRREFLVKHTDFIGLLWSQAVSMPSQFRNLQSLRERRQKLIGAGIENEKLTNPDWLQGSHSE